MKSWGWQAASTPCLCAASMLYLSISSVKKRVRRFRRCSMKRSRRHTGRMSRTLISGSILLLPDDTSQNTRARAAGESLGEDFAERRLRRGLTINKAERIVSEITPHFSHFGGNPTFHLHLDENCAELFGI